MTKKANHDLILNGSIVKAILSLTIPMIMNSFLQTMYNLTDTFWLGKLGTHELAAINLVTPLQNIVINFGAGITVAGAVLIAQYIGAGKHEDARSMANQIFACAMIFALICAGVIFLATGNIVTWLGAEGKTWEYANTYMRIVIFNMPFLYMVNIFTSVYQAQGNTVTPMLLNLCGITVNMILDPVFMLILGWGVAGAAAATVVATAVPAVFAFILLHSKNKAVYLDLKKIKFEKNKLKSIIIIGLPTAIGGSTMQFGFLLMSKNVLQYGTEAMAAYGIGNKINGLISLPSNAIGSAVSTIVGQNIGARQLDRAERGYRISRRISVLFLLAGGFVLSRMPVSTAIVSIFATDPDVIAMAADFLSIMALWCFTNGIYNSTMGLFQGSGHTEVTMAVDASRLWIFRFAVLFICEKWLHMGVRSIWYSVVISNAISTILLVVLYKMNIWKKKKILDDDFTG